MLAWNKSPQQPNTNEILYEFKYSFPKGWFNRFERIVDRIATTIVLCASFWLILGLYNYSAIYDTMILIFCYPAYLSLENWLVLGLYSILFSSTFFVDFMELEWTVFSSKKYDFPCQQRNVYTL